MTFRKSTIFLQTLTFFGLRAITHNGQPSVDYRRRCVTVQTGTALKTGLGKLTHNQLICPATPAAITTGVAARGQTQVVALTTLLAATVAGTIAAQPDVPRTIRIVAAKTGGTAVGDNAYTSANSRWVTVVGTDVAGRTITEYIPLNDTTAVESVRAFATVTSVTLPIRVNTDAGDQVSVGYGGTFALERSISSSADVLEFSRKATAATSYTIEALPTIDATSAASTLSAAVLPADLVINVVDGSGWPAGAQRTLATMLSPDGLISEEVVVTSRTTNALTVYRPSPRTTTWIAGMAIAKRPGMTLAVASITANDRFRVGYKTDLL